MGPLLLILLIVFGALIVLYGIMLLRRAEDDPLMRRIEEYASREEIVPIDEIEMSLPLSDRVFLPVARGVSRFIEGLAPQSVLDKTARNLQLAGNPRNMTAAGFWLIRFFLAIGLGVLGYFAATRSVFGGPAVLLYVLIGGGVGYLLPGMYLRVLIDRRKQSIIRKLPDALDLMTICVDAGLTFDGAMQRVAEKWDDPLSREFERVLLEMQLGKSRRQALRDMAERVDVPDVTTFVAAILQSDQLGVGISRVLRIQADQMRVRRRQRAEERAQQAPVRILFPLVFLILPSLFVVLLGPALIQIILTFGD